MTYRRILCLGALLLGLSACKQEDARGQIPPARGEDIAPPALPAIPGPGAGGSSTRDSRQITTGTTYPRMEAQISPTMSGVIAQVTVDEGDTVKKGQVLFKLRTDDLALRVKQAEAAQKSAEVQLSAARLELQRIQRLFEKNAVDRAQYERVQAQHDAAQAAVEQAKVAVAMARQALGDAIVRSPISGVVTARLKNPGEMATMMPPTVVLVVQDVSVLELRFRYPEGQAAKITPGQKVKARFHAKVLEQEATIVRISPAVDPRTRTVEIVAELPNEDGTLKPGMLAEVEPLGAVTP